MPPPPFRPLLKHGRLTAAFLSLTLVNPGLNGFAETKRTEAKPATAKTAHAGMTADQRAVHLLNRLAFGPTPDELTAVKRIGVDAWLEQQLHPERIADRALEARLTEFPALGLPAGSLMERFPDGAAIRQTANGQRAMPADPVLAAVYTRQIGIYKEKQAKKAGEPGDALGMKAADAMTAIPRAEKQAKDGDVAPLADGEWQAILRLAPEERMRRIIAMPPEEYARLRETAKGPRRVRLMVNLSPEQRELLADFENPVHVVVEEEQAQRLLRDIYSSRQLQEVMTTFWLNHFNIYLHKNEQEPYYLVSYEREVIRPRALGNLEDLLVATAESPAMLRYLDNAESTGPDSAAAEKRKQREAAGKPVAKNAPQGLNENYARELMELHTLGVNGGYTQKDVTEVAKVFSGWTVDKPAQGGGFEFDASRHEPGDKVVLGRTIKDGGQQEGLDVLHMLATNPSTAHFIAEELAIAFVSDTPPPALVRRMAASFLRSHGEIAAVLKTMVHAPEFWSGDAYRAKIKTPLEYVVSAARASGAEVTNTQPLVNALNQMGMPLYACVPPTGYPDKAADWSSTGALVTRMNFAFSLATNHFQGIRTSLPEDSSGALSPKLYERAMEGRLVPSGVSGKTRTAVLEHDAAPAQKITTPTAESKGQASGDGGQRAQMAGLLLGSPEFQRR